MIVDRMRTATDFGTTLIGRRSWHGLLYQKVSSDRGADSNAGKKILVVWGKPLIMVTN